MEIQIKTSDRHFEQIIVNENETIIDLKVQIRDKIGLSVAEQILMHQRKVLNDNMTVRESHINENSVIEVITLMRCNIQVLAKTTDGKGIPLEVATTDTILDIKKKIHEKIGIHVDEQILTYQSRIMADDKSIKEYSIEEMSVIDVVVAARNKMQVFAKTMDGKAVAVTVLKSDKIVDLKAKIGEKMGQSSKAMKLVYQGKILKHHLSVEDCQIMDKSIIDIVTKSTNEMQIYAKMPDGSMVSVAVRRRSSIIEITQQIEEKVGLPADEHSLIFQGKILKKHKTLDECNIAEKSIIDVTVLERYGMKIFAKTMDGNIFPLEVTQSDLIIAIKNKIELKIGVSTEKQDLVYQGVILEDNKTLADYSIEEDCVLDVLVVVRKGIQIYVRTADGREIALQVAKTDRLIEVKNKIEDKWEPLPPDHKLVCHGMILEDDGFVDDYHIDERSVIDVVTLLRNGILIFAKTQDGERVTLEVTRTDTIIEIKKMIEDRIGLVPAGQRLVYEEGILDDDGTVDDYDIDEMGVIDIVIPTKG